MYKESKQRRTISAIFAVLLIGCGLCIFIQEIHAQPEQANRKDARLRSALATQSEKATVHLYFARRDNHFLTSEQQVVPYREDPVDLARGIVEALIKGPQKGLVRTIAADTKLRAIYITSDGTCYVDLSRAVRKNHPGGSNSELLTVYSVINSLILNVAQIEQVKILIDGNESLTLAGHIDLQFPAKANMLLIR